jgi:long-chain fatty acid transport protein
MSPCLLRSVTRPALPVGTRRTPVLRRVALAAALAAPALAGATNGYFAHGYGIKAQGLAGAGIALPQDGLAAATNPAGTVEIGNRVDLGLGWFIPRRSADIVGNDFGVNAHYAGDGKKNFFIPEFGYGRQLSSSVGIGLAVYGNGGLNTDYPVNPYGRFGASGAAGVNLEQLFVVPSVAWRLGSLQNLGLALNIAHQRFAAKGIGIFGGFSSDPAHVSDQGTDSTTGAGLRIGWSGVVAPGLTLGATWASKVHGRFDKYRGLFADAGGFDVPENYGVGLAWQFSPEWTLASDVQTIRYSKVASVGNPAAQLFAGQQQLGVAGGPGFGWRDVTTLKVGLSHRWSNDLTLRAGLSHNRQPVPASETFFNILAPGVVQDHLSFGATWALAGGELSGLFAYGAGKTVNGVGSIPPGLPPGFGGGNANVRLKETIVGISYGWKLP